MTTRTIVPVLAALALTACVTDPAKDAPKATVAPAATTAAPAPTPAAPMATTTEAPATKTPATPKGAEVLAIDTTASKLLWTASKVTRTHPGGFKTFKGTISLVGGKPDTSRVDLDIDVDSIFTDAPDLVKHLKSPDFFDAATYPKATFASTAITPDPAGGGAYTVKGNLTLHGVTREISFPATIQVEEKKVTAKARFSFNRQDFKIAYKGAIDDLVRDDVLIEWDIAANRG